MNSTITNETSWNDYWASVVHVAEQATAKALPPLLSDMRKVGDIAMHASEEENAAVLLRHAAAVADPHAPRPPMNEFERKMFALAVYWCAKANNGDMQPTEERTATFFDRIVKGSGVKADALSATVRASIIREVNAKLYEDYQEWQRQ